MILYHYNKPVSNYFFHFNHANPIIKKIMVQTISH